MSAHRFSSGFLDGPYPRAFVHRGWHDGDLAGMENSMAAFRRAVDEGYHYIETDVHATSDGVVVVHHDDLLDRTTDGTGPVAAQPWSVVSRAKVGGRENVIRLEDMLEELPGSLINIDVKSEAAVGPVVDVLRRTGAEKRVCLASFSEARLVRLRALTEGRVLTSMGMNALIRFWMSGRLPAFLSRSGGRTRIAQVPVRHGRLTVVDHRLVALARRLHGEVHVWTIDEPAEINRLLDLGVDGIMTDRPQVLKDTLLARGVWASV